ncbi:endothelin-converting enzyme 1-like [Ornithodoros turicata]|uniref:endothelin-converting enzyme 1-like n=1 Tax=Ornithodoros turicata TaxID=34597 RepID=UPI0031395716
MEKRASPASLKGRTSHTASPAFKHVGFPVDAKHRRRYHHLHGSAAHSPHRLSPTHSHRPSGKHDTSPRDSLSSPGISPSKTVLGEGSSQFSSPSSATTKLSPLISTTERLASSSKRTKHKKLSSTLKSIAFLAIVGVMLLALLLKVVLKSQPLMAENCVTTACRQYATYLRGTMNETINPCDNFYGYVCGKISRTYSIAEDTVVVFRDEIIEKARLHVPHLSKQTAVDKAVLFFRSCEDVLNYEDDGQLPLVKLVLHDVGITWPSPSRNPDVLFTMLRLSSYWLWDTFITIQWTISSGVVAALEVGPSPHLPALLRQRNTVLRANKYYDYFATIYESFSPSNTTANSAFEEITSVERDAVPLFEARIYSDQVRAVTTVREFNYTAPQISSERWFKGLKTHFYDLVASNPAVYVNHVRFIQLIPILIERMGEQNFHLYLSWTVVQRLILLSNAKLVMNYHGNLEAARLNHRIFCYHMVQEKMGFALLSTYVSGIYTRFVKNDISNIMDNVRATLGDLYSKNFDQTDTFRATNLRTDSVLTYLDTFLVQNVEAYYANYSTMASKVVGNYKISCEGVRRTTYTQYTRLHHYRTADDSEVAVVDHIKGEIILAPTVLELPYYDEMVPLCVKYAAFGSAVAESLTKLLLSTYPEWHENSRKRIHQTAQCLTGQESSSETGVRNDTRTMHTIATIAAIDILLSVIKRKTNHAKGIGTLSPDKTFFVIWCYVLCGTGGNSRELCNDPLRHVDEFAEAFGCAKNSSMRKDPTCKLFSA